MLELHDVPSALWRQVSASSGVLGARPLSVSRSASAPRRSREQLVAVGTAAALDLGGNIPDLKYQQLDGALRHEAARGGASAR